MKKKEKVTTKESVVNYMRQEGIFNPITQKTHIHIIGVGSIGSFLALTLAKMGLTCITIWDYDKVEVHNIPNQFYRLQDVGKYKTTSTRRIVRQFTGITLGIINKEITDKTNIPDCGLNNIFITCLDNMETRQIIHEKLKMFPAKVIDLRMGGEAYEIYAVNTIPTDHTQEEILLEYEKTLTQPTTDLPCGERSIIYTLLSISAETARLIKEADQEGFEPTIIKRHMSKHMFLGGTR